jgi:protein-tyrosine phosphatase
MRIFGRWPYGTCSANWEGYQEAHGVTQIWERLFLGSIWDAQDLAKKNPLGITMVVTLSDAGVLRRRRSVNYLHFPIDDNPIDDNPIADQPLITIAQYNSIVDAIAGNVRCGNVLLNCLYGTSCSPIFAGAWLYMVGYKRSIDDALEEIVKLRPTVDPSPILLKRIKELL